MAKKPVVFVVPRGETADGRYHEVSWAKDGNLNLAFRRGNIKRFRDWQKAKAWGKKKACLMGAEFVSH